ncbi:Hypothetical protein HDN1F_32480 [gamma proteobacterium HdN1]|nr:Hypothetical protein HDN1F_32480 [gamma proteobacterium HdN1]
MFVKLNSIRTFGLAVFIAASACVSIAHAETAIKSGNSSNNSAAAISPDGSKPVKSVNLSSAVTALATSTCYDRWWLTGSYSWKWKSYYLYWQGDLKASSSTYYGTVSGMCKDLPLTVDSLQVNAQTVAYDSYYNTYPKLSVNKTLTNVSTVSGSQTKKIYGYGLTGSMCGGVSDHRATKNGITWYSRNSGGCAGNPGTW